jgi:hypothetical protein
MWKLILGIIILLALASDFLFAYDMLTARDFVLKPLWALLGIWFIWSWHKKRKSIARRN